MKILITASTFPLRPDDGRPRFVYDLANAMADEPGVDAVMALVPGSPDAPSQQRMGRVQLRRFTYFWPRRWQRLAYRGAMRDTAGDSLLSLLQIPFYVAAQTLTAWRLIRRHSIAVLNSHWMVPQGLCGAAVKRLLGRRIRHVIHAHAGDVYLLRRLPLGRWLARRIVRSADAVLAAGSHVRQTLDELLGYPSGAVLQPMGADPRIFAPPPDPPAVPEMAQFADGYLLFFGRLVEKKGVTHLLQAMPQVLRRWAGLGLVIIGSGPLEPALREEAERLGITPSVRFLGQQPQPTIARYLHRCRAAVVPSIIDSRGETEGMPTVVLEAMAAGARVVASDVAGIPDIVQDQRNGWLCRPGDADDLARAILTALADRPDSPIPPAAQDTARRFDWPSIAAGYLAVLRGCTQQPPGLQSPARTSPQ